MEDKRPELFIDNPYIENIDDQIGMIFYSYCYLPDIAKNVRTVVYSLEFNYPSFDQVQVKMRYRNLVDTPIAQTEVYGDYEKWKAEASQGRKANYNLYPFLSIFLYENPSTAVEDLETYSRITELRIVDDKDMDVEFSKFINKIIYLPDSYYKLFNYPKDKTQKYNFFAGHNEVIYVPLTGRTYTLQFTIQFYYFDYNSKEVLSVIPLLFLSMGIDIKDYKLVFNNKYQISAALHKNSSTDFPIDRIDKATIKKDKGGATTMFVDDITGNAIAPIINFNNRVMTGEYVKNIMPPDLRYDGMKLMENRHVLTMKEGVNVGIKKIDCPLPLSIYDLIKKNGRMIVPPVMEYFLLNNGGNPAEITISTEILGLSQPEIKRIVIGANELSRVKFFPTFIYEKTENLYEPKEFAVLCIIKDSYGQVVRQETYTIKVLPYDSMLWSMSDESTGKVQGYYQYIINWVKPNIRSKKLDEILHSAITRIYGNLLAAYNNDVFLSGKDSGIFNSREEYTRHIVGALYEAISETNPRYSNETLDLGRSINQEGQKIKYPKDSSEQGRGNCIDSTVMFASILENIGINPVIVFIPGHAYIGWETWDNSGKFEFLETTMLGYQGFKEAYAVGMENEKKYFSLQGKYGEILKKSGSRNALSSEVRKIYVKDLRQKGIYSKN